MLTILELEFKKIKKMILITAKFYMSGLPENENVGNEMKRLNKAITSMEEPDKQFEQIKGTTRD